VLQHEGEGGDNYFVDGFKVAMTIRKKYPELYKILLSHPFEWFHEDEKNFLSGFFSYYKRR